MTSSVMENLEGDELLFRAKRGARVPTFPPFFSLALALRFKEKSCDFDSEHVKKDSSSSTEATVWRLNFDFLGVLSLIKLDFDIILVYF